MLTRLIETVHRSKIISSQLQPTTDWPDIIAQLELLPPLQPIATQLMTQLADEYADLADVIAVLEQDAATVARLLSLANSALYQWPTPIVSLQDAVSKVLGLDVARAVGLGIAFSGSLDASQCPNLDQQKLWSDSLMMAKYTAGAINRLPQHRDHAPLAYTGALLSNLGVLALACIAPAQLNLCLNASSAAETEAQICAQFGQSHRDVAAQLARQWQLPAALIPLMTMDPTLAEGSDAEIAECCRLVRLLLLRFEEQQEPLISITDSPNAPHVIEALRSELDQLDSAREECDIAAQLMCGD